MPLVAELIGELDDENPVLGGQTDEHDDPDLAVEVECLPHERKADHPARHGERNGSYDHAGMDEAFELGGKEQVDEQEGESQDQRERAARFLVGLTLAALANRRHLRTARETGRATCREQVCPYVEIRGGAGTK